jgi:adenylate cyclase
MSTAPDPSLSRSRRVLRAAGNLLDRLVGWLPPGLVSRTADTLKRLSEAGTQGYPEDVRRRLKILNMIAYLIGLTTLIYALQHTVVAYERYAPLIWVNAALVPLAVLVPLAHRYSPILGGLLIVVAEWIALTVISALVGANSGVHLQYFVGAAAPFVVFGLERLRLVLLTVASGLCLHVICWFIFPASAAILDPEPHVVNGIYAQAAITTAVLIAASVWYAFSLTEAAKAETDRLLRNILPDPIVERLKLQPDKGIADAYPHATVLFADISGFVALSKSLGPDRIVALLNELVRSFDELADQHGIEKIKTIGDAYMAAAGVPTPVDHPEKRMAEFAHAMLGVVADVRSRHGIELHLRIGMASGPLMAGVIGTRKFSYDVWGDTVNLAARLESASNRGQILTCPDCRTALEPFFELEPHGEIDIKGVGLRPVWFVGPAKQPGAACLT